MGSLAWKSCCRWMGLTCCILHIFFFFCFFRELSEDLSFDGYEATRVCKYNSNFS